MAAGGDVAKGHERAKKIMLLARDFFAPGAAESVYREVAHFLRPKHAAQSMAGYLARFHFFAEKLIPICRWEGRARKFLRRRYVLGMSPFPSPGILGISAAARQMFRLLGPRGGAARQDVSAVADVDASSNGEDDVVPLTSRRKAKRGNRGDAGRKK